MLRVLCRYLAIALIGLLAACGGGNLEAPPPPGVSVLGDGPVVGPIVLSAAHTPPTDCTAARAFWQNLVDTKFFTAALVNPYLLSSSNRSLTTDQWMTAIPSFANHTYSGQDMRIDFQGTAVKFGACRPSGLEVTLSVTAVYSILTPRSSHWMPVHLFTLGLELPMNPGQPLDRTNPLRTAQVEGLQQQLVDSSVGLFPVAPALPLSMWAVYLQDARDPYMPPTHSCAAADYFWNDYLMKDRLQVTVNDSNLNPLSPIRLKTDSYNGDVPEIPARYPGQDMEILSEVRVINLSGCMPGQLAQADLQVQSRFFAVFHDQYSPLFTAAVWFRPDTTRRLDPANMLGSAAAPLLSNSNLDFQLVETFIDAFDVRVLSRYWWFYLQKR